MTGTIINVIAVLLGGGIGLAIKKGIPERIHQAVTYMLGLSTCVIGFNGLLGTMLTVDAATGRLHSSGELLLLGSLAVGALCGELLQIEERLGRVGLNTEHANRYPHEFSGGQQQRVGIARALAVQPEFIVCDEPISALDVSIQSQVVNMLEDMQQELGLTYLFIAHDLSVVRHISSRIGVMYLGTMVELAESYELNRNPMHPYTKTLLSAVPVPDPEVSRARQRIVLEGDIPSPMNPPTGCRFHTRCPYATDKCKQAVPEFKEYAPDHWAACHLLG